MFLETVKRAVTWLLPKCAAKGLPMRHAEPVGYPRVVQERGLALDIAAKSRD